MIASDFPIPVLGFAAFSGSGKTSLLEKLIPLLREQGLRLALIKHSHHDFEMDKPGKDSDRLRRAGAGQILLASKYRTAWIREGDGNTEPDL
ncbi:molybdopterin-guanine dinucleotide biosynthesis protein B, partial [Thiolapillus sp.]